MPLGVNISLSDPVVPAIFGGHASVFPVDALHKRYRQIRADSQAIFARLDIEDHGVQSMPEVSPPKWHLAHTSWFFETFVLRRYLAAYKRFDPGFEYLFNSYYNAVGRQYPRPRSGLLARPTLARVMEYRAYVDAAVDRLLENDAVAQDQNIEQILELGLHHEQQHQELLLTDIKYNFSINPMAPAYDSGLVQPESREPGPMAWIEHGGDPVSIGHEGAAFAFDNELPRHPVILTPFALARRPVTNGEYLEFIDDGGYAMAALWLSDGWAERQQQNWQGPLYWRRVESGWQEFTLGGMRPLDLRAPVSHISYYEADAYATWAGARLPREAEWEALAAREPVSGNLVQTGWLHPAAAPPATENRPVQLFGDVWEWTASAYAPYPGYRAAPGAFGEYNGKFMCNQMVLRGGSCVTPMGHIRASYRNFFYPRDRWQFSGLRLAKDLT